MKNPTTFTVVATYLDEMLHVRLKASSENEAIVMAVIYWFDHMNLDEWQHLDSYDWTAREEEGAPDSQPFISQCSPFNDGMVFFPRHKSMGF